MKRKLNSYALENKTVLITGGGTGIGRSITISMAKVFNVKISQNSSIKTIIKVDKNFSE